MDCPMCDGNGAVLGELGALRHYRCQACGWDYAERLNVPTVKVQVKPGDYEPRTNRQTREFNSYFRK